MDSWEKLDSSWDIIKEIIVYGYGRVAHRNISKLSKDFDIKYVIDNSAESRKMAIMGGV